MALRTVRQDERLRDDICKIDHFRGLDDEFVNRIANALDVWMVKRGDVIYEEGQKMDKVFVVGSEGKVKITPSAGKSVLCGSGEAFREEAIVSDALLQEDRHGQTEDYPVGNVAGAFRLDHWVTQGCDYTLERLALAQEHSDI